MTLLIFIWTFNCLRLIANTTSVSHGVPCWLAALFDLLTGVDVFEIESLRGTEESETLLDLMEAGDLRLCAAVPGDMVLLVMCSLNTLGDCGIWVKEADWLG